MNIRRQRTLRRQIRQFRSPAALIVGMGAVGLVALFCLASVL
jgi:threonine dehydrogenase-like Zn-dependent dehydrogenase